MKHFLPSLLLLLLSAVRVDAQGICDSTISIAPIQAVCAGTGETYLSVSHPGGVFSGPGLIYNTEYLDAKNLLAGFYTATYTITGPGGCTVSATRQFEVRQAEQAFPFVSGDIDCLNPNSQVMLDAYIQNNNAYWGGEWYGPSEANLPFGNSTVTTSVAGEYQFMAYSLNFNDCPAYANVNVNFHNNPLQIHLISCTDCSQNFPSLSIKIDTVPPGWNGQISHDNAGYFGANGCIPIFTTETGLWKASIRNSQNGCVSQTSKNFTTAQNAHPHVNAGSYSGLGCGVQGHLLGAGPTPGPMFNISWSTPDGHIVADGNTYYPLVDQPGTYMLTAVNTFTGCSGSDFTVLTQAPSPVTTQIAVLCAGESLNGHTQSGTYFDTLYQSNGCFKTQITKLFVLAPILDVVQVTPDDGQMTGSIQYSITQGWPPFVYEWSNGATSASIFNLSAGLYTVTVTDANDCQLIRQVLVPIFAPYQHPAADRVSAVFIKARLYPNPVAAGLVEYTLEINSNKTGEATILLNDVLGRNISTRTVQMQEGKNVFPITENLAEGIYAVYLQGDFGTKEVSKLMVAGP